MGSLRDFLTPTNESIMDDENAIMDEGAKSIIWDWFEKTSNFKSREEIKKYVKVDGNFIDITEQVTMTIDVKKNSIPQGYSIRNAPWYSLVITGAKTDDDINNHIPQNSTGGCGIKLKQCKMDAIHFKPLSIKHFVFDSTSRVDSKQTIYFTPDSTIERIYSNSKGIVNMPKITDTASLQLETVRNILIDMGVIDQKCRLEIPS
jgi:hypothetical protein